MRKYTKDLIAKALRGNLKKPKARRPVSATCQPTKPRSESDIMKITMREIAKMQGLPKGFYPVTPSELLRLRMKNQDEERRLNEALELQQIRARENSEQLMANQESEARKRAQFVEKLMEQTTK